MPNQSDWYWCKKCAGLAYFGTALCPAGGIHDHSQSSDYTLRYDLTTDLTGWRWCSKCQSMSFFDGTTIGPCPGGGLHNQYGGARYAISTGQTGATGQTNWKMCSKCRGLFFADGSSKGRCQAGGDHDGSGSGNYVFSPTGAFQPQWRRCTKCNLLSFDGMTSCAAGGSHVNIGSYNYTIPLDDPAVRGPGQEGWRWCSKCYGLSYGSVSLGSCPRSGQHDHSTSGNYGLRIGAVPGAQGNWSWCSQCQLLWYTGNGKARCPSGPDTYHVNSGSLSYALEFRADGIQASSTVRPGSPTGSTSPTITPGPGTGDKKSLSSGAVAGIVIGSILPCLMIALLIWYYRRRRRLALANQTQQDGQYGSDLKNAPESTAQDAQVGSQPFDGGNQTPVVALAISPDIAELDGSQRHEVQAHLSSH